jgi:hypothetical protein
MKPTTPAPPRPARPTVATTAPRTITRPITRPTMATPAPRATRPSIAPPPPPPAVEPAPPPKLPPTPNEILARLIALTPAPDPNLEVDELIAAFDAMLTRRAQVIGELAAPPAGATIALDGAGRQLRAELERRDAAWHDLLASALRIVGSQRNSISKLRAYGGGL